MLGVKRSLKNYPVAHLFLKLPLLFLPCISISVQTPVALKNTKKKKKNTNTIKKQRMNTLDRQKIP